MKENKIKTIAFSALFVGMVAIISQIQIPFAIPLTFQVFGISLCGYVLGAKWGAVSVAVYILLGCFGLPVFSGFKGGFAVLFEATGGFILGFLPLVFFCGAVRKKKKVVKYAASFIGLFVCHLWGIIQFSQITQSGILVSLLTVSLPYIIKDILLVVTADLISKNIKERL